MATKQSNDKELLRLQKAAKDAEYKALVAFTYYKFLKAHVSDAQGGISPCDANRNILESFIDANVLPAEQAASWEISLLAMENQLARVKDPVIQPPKPAATPKLTPVQRTEQEELRDLVQQFKGDSRGLANAMRARLKVHDVHSAQAQRKVLPAEYDRARLFRMSGTEMRNLKNRFGFDAINDRLSGRN